MKPEFFSKKIFKQTWFILSVITAAGLAARLWVLTLLRGLTFDEMISFSVAEKPLAQIWSYVKWEMHPPLHYYFLHFWFAIFGTSEISAHLSSVLLSLAAIIALYFLGKEIFASRRAGLAAAALYAFSPLFCFYGVWARMYSMLFLTAVLSFLFFWKLIKARGRGMFTIAALFTLFTLTALFSHLTAGLVIALEGVYLLYLLLTRQKKIQEILRNFWLPTLIIFAVYGSWFWYFWRLHLSSLGGSAWYFQTQGAQFWIIPFFDSLMYLTPFNQYFFEVLAFSLLAILGFSAFAAVNWDKIKSFHVRVFLTPATFFCLVIFILSFAGLFSVHLYVLRYAIIPAIGLFLLLGYGFFRLDRSWRAVVIFLYIVLTVLSFSALSRVTLISDNWQGAADYISQNERPGDKVVGSLYTNVLSLNFYYRGKLPVGAPLDEKYRSGDQLLSAIKSNIYPTTNQATVGQLSDLLGDSRRVFFLVSDGNGAFPGIYNIVYDWLKARGFTEVGSWPNGSNDTAQVLLLEKK